MDIYLPWVTHNTFGLPTGLVFTCELSGFDRVADADFKELRLDLVEYASHDSALGY
jgi:hypothetical protein